MYPLRAVATERVLGAQCAVQERLHGTVDIAELLKSGVNPATVLALYPVDHSQLTALVRQRCVTPEQVWIFVEELAALLNGQLGNLYSSVGKAEYRNLPHATKVIAQDEHFLALCALGERVHERHKQRRSLDRGLLEALESAADVQELVSIWLADPTARWHHQLLQALASLRLALPALSNPQKEPESAARTGANFGLT